MERLADLLGRSGVRVARVVHSGKTRARQTADAFAQALTPGRQSEAGVGLHPNDPTDTLADEAGRLGDDMVVVGHLPNVGKLVARLVSGREDAGVVAFRPGAVVCLERGEDGSWTIAWMLYPDLFGGYPGRSTITGSLRNAIILVLYAAACAIVPSEQEQTCRSN